MATTEQRIENHNRPMPELFQRNDMRNSGGWDVGRAKAVRGEPFITVSGRIMRVPLDDSELAQAIRGHEQVHVKVSPQDISPYVTEAVTEDSIRSAEEARVNFIAQELGFPMKALITGSERHEGELLAQRRDWTALVHAVAASINTGSLSPLIAGIRKENPAWADSARTIASELVKYQKGQIKKIKKRNYGTIKYADEAGTLQHYGSTTAETSWNAPRSSGGHTSTGRILGMNYTVEMALLIESIASTPPKPPEKTSAKQTGGGKDTDVDPEKLNRETGDDTPEELADEEQAIDRQEIQNKAKKVFGANIGSNGVGEWIKLEIERMPLTTTVQGALGYKRGASQVGRNPRRMARYLTDPEKRIFDRKIKAAGGVVLIDVSGSMSLSKEQVKEIMLAAPGCTVLCHSASFAPGPNLWVLADKGKICDKLPRVPGGNGNDLPALEYAISLKQGTKAPILWITDGLVYKGGGGALMDEMECARTAHKHSVHMEYNVEDAITYLQGLQAGNKPQPKVLERWREHLPI
jgi:hypothetical protein